MVRADEPRVHIGDIGVRRGPVLDFRGPVLDFRGPVLDFPGRGPNGNAWCVCDHGTEWEEGALLEPDVPACRECSEASLGVIVDGQGE